MSPFLDVRSDPFQLLAAPSTESSVAFACLGHERTVATGRVAT